MKINLHILLLGILLVSALYSCNNEDDLDISEKKDNRFDLPQGDHDFDDQIVEWNNNYGTSVLYRFSSADLNYHFTSSSNDVVYDVKVEAEEEGIRAAVQFLKEDFFDLYSDEVKKELFPAKILMAGMLYQNNNYVPLWDTISQGGMDFKRGYMVRGIDHITLPHVDKDFAQRIQKPEYRERLKVALNRTFIQFLMNPYNDIIAKIEYNNILNTFASYSLISEDAKNGTTNPYSSGNQWYDEEVMYQLGFLEYGTYWNFWEPYYWTAPDKDDDFYSFLEFIFTQTKSELQANPLYTNYPQIQKKCDYLIEVFAEYGIDLHCVGGKE